MNRSFWSVLGVLGLGFVLMGSVRPAVGADLKAGDKAPAFSLPGSDGMTYSLDDFKGKQTVILYFYPKADTPGCTAQACSLRDAYTDLQSKGVKVFGVSLDTVDTQKQFHEKEHLPFELLSDRDKKITSAFGVPLILNSLATRQAYLFKDGKLVWMDGHASTNKQAHDVLDVLAQQT